MAHVDAARVRSINFSYIWTCMYYKNRPSANWTCIKFAKNICDSLPLTEYFRINRRMSNIATILDTEQDRTLHHNIKLQPDSNLVLGGYSVYWIECSTIKAFFERDFTSIFASSSLRETMASVPDKAATTKKRRIGLFDGCFDRNTEFFREFDPLVTTTE